MQDAKHIVRKLVFDASLDSPQSGEVTKGLHQLARDIVPVVIDEVLANFSLQQRTITLKKVSVELGTIGADELFQSFPSKLTLALGKVLQTQLGNKPGNKSVPIKEGKQNQQIETLTPTRRTSSPGSILDKTLLKAQLESFRYFLEKGVLPLEVNRVSVLSWVEELITHQLPSLIQLVQTVIMQPNPRRRLTYHLTDSQLVKLIAHQPYPGTTGMIKSLLEGFASPQWKKTPGLGTFDPVCVKEAVLIEVFMANNNPEPLPVLKRILLNLAQQWAIPVRHLASALGKSVSSAKLDRMIREIRWAEETNASGKPLPGSNAPGEIVTRPGGPNVPTNPALPGKAKQDPWQEDPDVSNNNQKIRTDPSDVTDLNLPGSTVLVQNAGIIITWPFLEGYFDQLGLTTGGGFLPGLSQEKAVHLLHYLATARGKAEEYELALCKLLCGMALDEPIPPSIPCSPGEKEFTDGLIEALIKNWPAVGDTDISSVRETFLKRPGRVSKKANGWLLRIERQTWDILLDSLPWGLGLIHLPWMQHMIHVEWETA